MLLEVQLSDKNVNITLDDNAKKWIADNGYDPLFGARPISRLVQEHIKKPLADELLFGDLVFGGTVLISVRKNKLNLKIKKSDSKIKLKREQKLVN